MRVTVHQMTAFLLESLWVSALWVVTLRPIVVGL